MTYILNLFAAVMLAAFRVGGYKSEFFQAIAHLYVGGLIGAGMAYREYAADFIHGRWFYWGLAIILSIVEVGCFIYFKGQ